MQMLVDAAASNFALDFTPIGFATLDSVQADVRQAAIELLGENENTQLLRKMIEMAQNDPVIDVRAEATRALGRFVLIGELGDLSDELVEAVQSNLMKIIGNAKEDSEVRRFAIESVSNCTREGIPAIIAEAYRSDDPNMRLSAVVAMGRSCDERWEDKILEELESRDDEIRIAAIRAAGELQLDAGARQIIRNVEEGEREEQEVAIWSLGEIGGKEALRVLGSLLEGAEDAEDEALIDLLD
jgi:HEAT repeat protein